MTEEFVYGIDPRPVLRIAQVTAGTGYTLQIDWEGGGSITVDLAGWIGLHSIEALRPRQIFAKPEIGEDRDTVQWAADDDLCIDSVHLELLAAQQRAFSPQDLASWQDHHGISNREAAVMMGVTPNTWLNYRSGKSRIPHVVAIACRAMDRDSVVLEAHYRPRWTGRPAAAAE